MIVTPRRTSSPTGSWFAAGLLAIAVVNGGALLGIALATRSAPPPGASGPAGPPPAPSLSAQAPAEALRERPEAPGPSCAREAAPLAAPSNAALRSAPVVPLPDDPGERAERLEEVRRARVTRMLEARSRPRDAAASGIESAVGEPSPVAQPPAAIR